MYDEVIRLLQEGKGKEALAKLAQLVGDHDGGVSTNSGGAGNNGKDPPQ